jgi:hypothetical protein
MASMYAFNPAYTQTNSISVTTIDRINGLRRWIAVNLPDEHDLAALLCPCRSDRHHGHGSRHAGSRQLASHPHEGH